MSSQVLPLDDVERISARVAGILGIGGVVVLPTDTVYALVADAFQPVATRRLADCKGRDAGVPLTVLIRSPRQVAGLVSHVPEPAERLMASYWPGPLTLLFSAADGLTWDIGLTQGTVALRMPADDLLLSVIAEVGPVACSGANRDTQSLVAEVDGIREQLAEGVALYVDGGARPGPPSTIVDATGDDAVVLRQGAISASAVEQVASGAVGWGARPEEQEAPGSARGEG